MFIALISRKRIKTVRKRKTSGSNLNRPQEIAFTISHQVANCPSSSLRRTRCKTHGTGCVLYWRSTVLKLSKVRASPYIEELDLTLPAAEYVGRWERSDRPPISSRLLMRGSIDFISTLTVCRASIISAKVNLNYGRHTAASVWSPQTFLFHSTALQSDLDSSPPRANMQSNFATLPVQVWELL